MTSAANLRGGRNLAASEPAEDTVAMLNPWEDGRDLGACDKCNISVCQGGCKCDSNCACLPGKGGSE